MIEIREKVLNGASIVALCGRLNAETAATFAEWSNSRDDGTLQSIILDFSELTYLSSAGLRAILTMNRHAEKSSTTLLFCGLGGIVRDVFRTAGLLQHLQIYAGVNEAMESAGLVPIADN